MTLLCAALHAGLRFTAVAVVESTLIACLHSLGTVQVWHAQLLHFAVLHMLTFQWSRKRFDWAWRQVAGCKPPSFSPKCPPTLLTEPL